MAEVSSINDLAAQSLDLVSRELSNTLDTARQQLEGYVDGRSGREALMHCADMLHLAHGALKIVEIHGAALLTDEMEQTCHHLNTITDQDQLDKGVEALTRAMVQLPAYLERILSGGRDVALVLLPLLNDLRGIRGQPLLSEGTLLLLDATPRQLPASGAQVPVAETAQDQAFRKTASALRPAFQVALLGWIRGDRPDENVAELIKLTTALEQAATSEPVKQLWYVLGGLLEALQQHALEATVNVKRLLGQADRQLKRLIDGGEQPFVDSPPVELINNMLYYVARADCKGQRLDAIRADYGLTDLVPGEGELLEARESLAGPSVKLMRTVAQAIKEDLGSVKDVLDIFVRTGMEDVDELKPQLDMLKKISDTLGVLGLEKLRDQIQQETQALTVIIANQKVADEAVLEKMAATLLDVEDTLDQQLIRAVVAREEDEVAESESHAQYRHVTQAVMGECIVNLAKVKEAVIQLVEDPGNVRAVDQVAPQLRGITAGLLMLNKTRAVRVVERVGAVITSRLAPGTAPIKPELLERLADAIVSVEYYMETLSSGRSDPWYMLDNSERCLDLLERLPMPEAPKQPQPLQAPTEREAAEAQAEPQPVQAEPLVMEVDEERSDPELVELFIEEAKEEVANVSRYLPAWRDNLEDTEALISLRRSFHTLKGSGRMVGAQLIGEYAWSIENLLNRIINQTLQTTEPMLEFMSRAAAALPQLVEQLEIGTSPRADIHLLMKQAEAFAEGDPDAESLTSESLRLPALTEDEAPQSEDEAPGEALEGAQMDPVLAEIFAKEMRGHLVSIRDYLAGIGSSHPPYAVEEPLYRACHTLAGSANMAGFKPAVALVTPLAQHLARHFEAGSGLSEASLGALAGAADALERIAEALSSNSVFSEDLSSLVAVLDELAAEEVEAAAVETVPGESQTSETAAEFDPEIAAIFTEEASEILENAEIALQEFRQQPAQAEHLVEMQRLLHTLKGGARMAGIVAMGNLSHALETLLSALAAGELPKDEQAIGIAQRSLDQLHQMRDTINAGHAVEEAADIMGKIGALFTPSPRVEAEEIEAPVQEPIQEPSDTMLGIVSLTDKDFAELEAIGNIRALEASDTEPSEPAEEKPAAAEELVEPEESPADQQDEATAPTEAPAPSVAAAGERAETARVDADLLDALLNGAGEISIFQSRLNQQVHSIDFHLSELAQTVTRLREQLRKLEAETEAQILHRHQQDVTEQDFDPLELDRYSTIQQLSRALAETASDVASINDLLRDLTNETHTLLTQQVRVTTELQDGLMRTRMVPMQRYVSRFARIVRQASAESGKPAELHVEGASGELDRQVLERMLPPFEHLLRNAVVHGIEDPAARGQSGKDRTGRVDLKVQREGSEVIIEISDDGAGLDIHAIREKAREQGLLREDQQVSDADAMELILEPGFSTAGELTQTAGRGVGLDVVDTEVKKLGGSLRIESERGAGTRFIMRLPYTLAVTHALVVSVGEETFALPLPSVEGVTRVAKDDLLKLLTEDEPKLEYGGVSYRVQHLGTFVGAAPSALPEDESSVPLVLVRAGDNSSALITDDLEGSREVVVKTLGPHIASIPGVSGATILGDGRIIVILDAGTLVRSQRPDEKGISPAQPLEVARQLIALVVDDSITMRRVTQRLLERRGVRVLTARDGLDAITVLQDHEPDIILLDIEMPRMDGYQFASHVRNDPKTKDLPIVMITSRSGEKHRARAIEIGVNDYLSKPYQEAQLIKAMEALLERAL